MLIHMEVHLLRNMAEHFQINQMEEMNQIDHQAWRIFIISQWLVHRNQYNISSSSLNNHLSSLVSNQSWCRISLTEVNMVTAWWCSHYLRWWWLLNNTIHMEVYHLNKPWTHKTFNSRTFLQDSHLIGNSLLRSSKKSTMDTFHRSMLELMFDKFLIGIPRTLRPSKTVYWKSNARSCLRSLKT
jgi:hypothetical protein